MQAKVDNSTPCLNQPRTVRVCGIINMTNIDHDCDDMVTLRCKCDPCGECVCCPCRRGHSTCRHEDSYRIQFHEDCSGMPYRDAVRFVRRWVKLRMVKGQDDRVVTPYLERFTWHWRCEDCGVSARLPREGPVGCVGHCEDARWREVDRERVIA